MARWLHFLQIEFRVSNGGTAMPMFADWFRNERREPVAFDVVILMLLAVVEQEGPKILTVSGANIMPGDRIDVRLRYGEPLRWEDGRIRLVFPKVVGSRYIPGSEAVGHMGSGWASDTNSVSDASRI